MLQFRHLREIRHQIRSDAFAQCAYGEAHRQRATVLFTGEKEKLRAVGRHGVEEDAH